MPLAGKQPCPASSETWTPTAGGAAASAVTGRCSPTDTSARAADTRIAKPVAAFTSLDKVTGRIINFDVYLNETVQFGSLQITPRACYSRAPTEAPLTDSFVEVDELTIDRTTKRIFTG